jgi:hypothetical protein
VQKWSQVEEHDRQSDGRVLDRPIDLASIPVEWLAWSAVFLAALTIRLIGRTTWPLSPGESEIARDAYALIHGNDLSDAAASRPATVQFAALMFFLFGDTDYTARLVPLIAGLGVLGMLVWVRRWIGNLPAICVAILWTVSPTMMMSSARLDGGMLLVLASLAILSLVFAISVDPGIGKSIMLGVTLSLAITVHPLGWIFAPLGFLLAAYMIRDPEFSRRWPQILAGLLVSLLVISTHFGTRPRGVIDFPGESWRALWNDHLSTAGADWHLTFLTLLVDEPLAVVMALTGIVLIVVRADWKTSAPPALMIAFTAWAVPAVTLGILLGGKSPALYAVSLFPVLLVGGFGLSMVVEGTVASGYLWRRIALTVLLGLALLVASIRLLDLLREGPATDASGWIVSAAVLGILVVLPLGYLTMRLGRELGASVVPMSLLVIALILGVSGLRSSLLLPVTTTDRPGEILVAGSSAPSVGQVEQRIRTYSRDVTTYVRDVRDVTGGHGLAIALEREIAGPFVWYFRAFPDLTVFDDPGELETQRPPDIIIARPSTSEAYLQQAPDYGHRTYARVYHLPESLGEPALGEALAKVLNPLEYRGNFNFVVYRETDAPTSFEQFTLMMREDHAFVFWGPLPE